ncbi:hypothetical protein KR222_002835 [Zaprionus bogoriensis]|nr:hypothetical protein KR222_002835 [Zaprionus bogoriensis]
MENVNCYIFLIVAAVACAAGEDGFPYTYPIFDKFDDASEPAESALFLTPMLNNESLSALDVQAAARVTDPMFLGVESYAGFLTVDEVYNSNLFFWYFPAEQHSEHAPVVLWLQGGPGASSMLGLFYELGPLALMSGNKLKKRKYTWSKTHNLIFIDSPVGTGFSFTDHEKGYARNDRDVASNLYEALRQLYRLFGWGNSSSFWLTGESYAGKYVPALAYHIHKVQQDESKAYNSLRIPLKGMAIGNGLSDPVHQLQYGDYFYQLGLIDEHGLKQFHEVEAACVESIRNNDMERAFEIFDSLIMGNLAKGSLFMNLTGFESYYNFLQAEPDSELTANLFSFMRDSGTRHAVHVGSKRFHENEGNNTVKMFLRKDHMVSVRPWIEELLEHYTVCIYSGQVDVILSYPQTRHFLKHLKFSAAEEFKNAPRRFWRVDGLLAGYVKQAGNLIEILVRNAGHLAPMDQPRWLYEMINHLTH